MSSESSLNLSTHTSPLSPLIACQKAISCFPSAYDSPLLLLLLLLSLLLVPPPHAARTSTITNRIETPFKNLLMFSTPFPFLFEISLLLHLQLSLLLYISFL